MLGYPLQDIDLQVLAETIAKFPSYAGRLQIVEALPEAPMPLAAVPIAAPIKIAAMPAEESIVVEVEEPRSSKKTK
jgi:hypothetical protein